MVNDISGDVLHETYDKLAWSLIIYYRTVLSYDIYLCTIEQNFNKKKTLKIYVIKK